VKRTLLAALAATLAVPLAAEARALFTPNDPLVPKQYYLAQDHAFDGFGDTLPGLDPVRVAVIDSGLDTSHPEFQPRSQIWAARNFLGGAQVTDDVGHGTFVAGEIAADVNNNQGIAGIAFPAKLIIAKIAGPDGVIDPIVEAAAIRWSVDHGAQVINLSLGGPRDPLDPKVDSFSAAEAAAVEYAVRHGVVVVAAAGNCDNSPTGCPWNYADYPSALPHVIGASALTQNGNVASFSNRDQIYNDISAPGQQIISTVPLSLTATFPSCADQGYSDCGPANLRSGQGTSFAAPQVAAAAALLLALKPTLKPDQVSYLLERSAADLNASDGCRACPNGRDALTGWGRLDVEKAIQMLQERLPPADRYEPNDDAGNEAATLPAKVTKLTATLDFWDDQVDVYRIRLVAKQQLQLRVRGPQGSDTDLLLWKPGTVHINDLRKQRLRAAQAIGDGASKRIVYRVPKTGWYYVEVKLETRGFGPYSLSIGRK
jgi:subtilisin family serine protease